MRVSICSALVLSLSTNWAVADGPMNMEGVLNAAKMFAQMSGQPSAEKMAKQLQVLSPLLGAVSGGKDSSAMMATIATKLLGDTGGGDMVAKLATVVKSAMNGDGKLNGKMDQVSSTVPVLAHVGSSRLKLASESEKSGFLAKKSNFDNMNTWAAFGRMAHGQNLLMKSRRESATDHDKAVAWAEGVGDLLNGFEVVAKDTGNENIGHILAKVEGLLPELQKLVEGTSDRKAFVLAAMRSLMAARASEAAGSTEEPPSAPEGKTMEKGGLANFAMQALGSGGQAGMMGNIAKLALGGSGAQADMMGNLVKLASGGSGGQGTDAFGNMAKLAMSALTH